MADQRAAGDGACLGLIEERVGVAELRRRGVVGIGTGVVRNADDDVAVRREMVSDVVVPLEIVPVAMTEHDQRSLPIAAMLVGK